MERGETVSLFATFFFCLSSWDLGEREGLSQEAKAAKRSRKKKNEEDSSLTAMLNATQPRAGRASDARIAPRPSPDAAATSATTDCAARALPAESRVVAAAAAVAALAKVACFSFMFFVGVVSSGFSFDFGLRIW